MRLPSTRSPEPHVSSCAFQIAPSATLSGRSGCARLMRRSLADVRAEHVPDEERAHLLDELARLARLAHRLDEMRERVEILAHEADHELVVLGVDAVTRETDVGRELLLSVGDAERCVLAHDVALLD